MHIVTYTGMAILSWLNSMHTECATHLQKYPYFYSPPLAQKINPSDTIYINEKNALIAVVTHDEQRVGIAAGIPLSSPFLAAHYFSPQIIKQFREKGHDPESIWYMGYFFLNEKHRNQTTVDAVYRVFTQTALDQEKKQICYIDVIRKENDPRAPLNTTHPEPWEDHIEGFVHSGVEIESTWPTLQPDGSIRDETHQLYFLLKDL